MSMTDKLATAQVVRHRDALMRRATAVIDTAASNNRDLTDDERIEVDALEAAINYINTPQRKAGAGPAVNMPQPSPHFLQASGIEFPARKVAPLRAFSRIAGLTPQEREEKARRLGMWAMAIKGNTTAQQWCGANGIQLLSADQVEGVNWQGGYLVPEEFDRDIIDLRLQYGVFRRNARVSPMTSETKRRPRRQGGLTAYFIDEQDAITKSGKTWDQVPLVAKDLYVLDVYSGQLGMDAIINVGDDLADEIAYAFSVKEDGCGFIGDGTSTYGGIVGLKAKLTAATASLVTAASGTHTAWSGITLANFNSMVGKLPPYARMRQPKWYFSASFWGTVVSKLLYAAGGNTIDLLAGPAKAQFLGYPVELTETFPSSATTAEVVAAFGDLWLAADFGDRLGTAIAFSDSAVISGTSMFETNQTAIRGWERFDINVHDVGDTTNAGPMIGLLTAS